MRARLLSSNKLKVNRGTKRKMKRNTKRNMKRVTNRKMKRVTKRQMKRVTKRQMKRVTKRQMKRVTKRKVNRVTKRKMKRVTKRKVNRVTKRQMKRVINNKLTKLSSRKKKQTGGFIFLTALAPKLIDMAKDKVLEMTGYKEAWKAVTHALVEKAQEVIKKKLEETGYERTAFFASSMLGLLAGTTNLIELASGEASAKVLGKVSSLFEHFSLQNNHKTDNEHDQSANLEEKNELMKLSKSFGLYKVSCGINGEFLFYDSLNSMGILMDGEESLFNVLVEANKTRGNRNDGTMHLDRFIIHQDDDDYQQAPLHIEKDCKIPSTVINSYIGLHEDALPFIFLKSTSDRYDIDGYTAPLEWFAGYDTKELDIVKAKTQSKEVKDITVNNPDVAVKHTFLNMYPCGGMINLFSRKCNDKHLKEMGLLNPDRPANFLIFSLYQVGPNNHRVCYPHGSNTRPHLDKVFSLVPSEVSEYMQHVLKSTCSIHNVIMAAQVALMTQKLAAKTRKRVEDRDALFSKFDADGSGELDADELMELMEEVEVEVSDKEELTQLMRQYDADGNGRISREEFADWYRYLIREGGMKGGGVLRGGMYQMFFGEEEEEEEEDEEGVFIGDMEGVRDRRGKTLEELGTDQASEPRYSGPYPRSDAGRQGRLSEQHGSRRKEPEPEPEPEPHYNLDALTKRWSLDNTFDEAGQFLKCIGTTNNIICCPGWKYLNMDYSYETTVVDLVKNCIEYLRNVNDIERYKQIVSVLYTHIVQVRVDQAHEMEQASEVDHSAGDDHSEVERRSDDVIQQSQSAPPSIGDPRARDGVQGAEQPPSPPSPLPGPPSPPSSKQPPSPPPTMAAAPPGPPQFDDPDMGVSDDVFKSPEEAVKGDRILVEVDGKEYTGEVQVRKGNGLFVRYYIPPDYENPQEGWLTVGGGQVGGGRPYEELLEMYNSKLDSPDNNIKYTCIYKMLLLIKEIILTTKLIHSPLGEYYGHPFLLEFKKYYPEVEQFKGSISLPSNFDKLCDDFTKIVTTLWPPPAQTMTETLETAQKEFIERL